MFEAANAGYLHLCPDPLAVYPEGHRDEETGPGYPAAGIQQLHGGAGQLPDVARVGGGESGLCGGQR